MDGDNSYMLTETNWKGFTVRVIFKKAKDRLQWFYFDGFSSTWKPATKTPEGVGLSEGLLSVQGLLLSLAECKDIHLMETFLEYVL